MEPIKKTVLITGGAGYLGCVITDYFLKTGKYRIICLDNLMWKQQTPMLFVHNPDYEFVYGDSRNENTLKPLIARADVIIPLAALVGMPLCNMRPHDAKTTNYDAIVLIDKLRLPHQKVIYPTTNSGYGTQSGDVFCTEETPLEPISLYGQTKVDAEKHLLNSEKDAITLRLATVFGISPRMRTDLLVNDFVLRAMRDEVLILYEADFKRNYIYIRDVARCFEHCIDNFESMKNKAYNVGLEDANLSKRELAEKIKAYLPRLNVFEKDVGEDPDKRNYIVSNKRILSTGFTPIFSLDDGIKELIKGYSVLLKNNPYGNA